ncbi:FkbM family methyltransferase [Chitinophaga dinghuensis]|uniref:FkbM family methyltransferase n=1 Tax=Chitinophaga dinghuensis TaxID=1539050 RepID=A0A327W8I0_9BACT|nr:FkbM family methyltransferase [Chitinophaga dinghuensis]RAJ85778.1 FkbM family methyltransferase [Chitinophaga dinghuensis]
MQHQPARNSKLSKLRRLLKNFTPDNLRYSEFSFAQEGEDMILRRFVGKKTDGFFVDIGAHHPIRFSNTYRFYLDGWRGINVDAMPGSMLPFQKKRPRDINLEVPVSDKKEVLKFYIFNEPALNTFSEKEARAKDGKNNYKITDVKELQTVTLEDILHEHLPAGQQIDFMSVDVEGLDLQVLQSNNWEKYRPEYLLVEDLMSDVSDSLEGPLYKFLQSKDYKLVARSYNTAFYHDNRK